MFDALHTLRGLKCVLDHIISILLLPRLWHWFGNITLFGNRANACTASFQAVVLIWESKVIFWRKKRSELAAGEFADSLYLKTKLNRKKRLRKRWKVGRKEKAVQVGVASWNSIIWVKQQVRLDGHKESLLAWTAIIFWSIVQTSQHCNFIVTWRGERVKPPYLFPASPTAWACLVSVMWKAARWELDWDHNSFHSSTITSAVW